MTTFLPPHLHTLSQSLEAESPHPTSGHQTRTDVTSQVSPWLSTLAYFLARRLVFRWQFKRMTVVHQDRLPQDGPVILAPMHRSRWDALVVPYAAGRTVTGRDVHFMVSANEMTGVQGWFIRRLGGFPIDTARPGRSSIRHGIDLLSQGKMMVVFPEGNIYRTQQLNPLKSGIAHMALQAAQRCQQEVKIVPMGIAYDRPYPGPGSSVVVTIGHPLSTQDYHQLPSKKADQALTEALTMALNTLHPEALLASAQGE